MPENVALLSDIPVVEPLLYRTCLHLCTFKSFFLGKLYIGQSYARV